MTMAEAIISGNLEAVKKIQLENPSCIDELYNGITLPNLAASTGNTEIFKYIVEYSRASFNETDDDNRTVLFYAVPTDNVELVKYIVERLGFSGLSGDRNLVTPYDIAIESGAKKVISYFKELYGDIDGMYRNRYAQACTPTLLLYALAMISIWSTPHSYIFHVFQYPIQRI